jgi:hypothetical protein
VVPEPPPNPTPYEVVIGALGVMEKAFVLGALSGQTYENAALSAGYAEGSIGQRVAELLARPQIALALQETAPLIADRRHALELLVPFALKRLVQGLSEGKATGANAAKDLLDRYGLSSIAKSQSSVLDWGRILEHMDTAYIKDGAPNGSGRSLPLPKSRLPTDSSE